MPRIHGPWGPIPYRRDPLGFPRIRVRHRAEGAYALGWMHGHDRQGQVRLLLAAAHGRLMELLGDRPLTRAVDYSVKSMGLTADLDAQFDALDDATRTIGGHYCEGFERGADDGGTPALLRLLPAARRPYEPKDMIALVRLTGWFGLNSITQTAALILAKLASQDTPEALTTLLYGDAAADIDPVVREALKLPTQLTNIFSGGPSGSNAFAVSGDKSSTGKPLLMGEFHMEIGKIPPVMYAAHLDIDDEDDFVHGICVAGLPNIASGRNRRCAWSYTFGHAANVSIGLQRCKAGRRASGEDWIPLRRRDETVRVRGRSDELWTFWDSDQGTIMGDAASEQAVHLPSMQWHGFEHTFRDLMAFADIHRCDSVRALLKTHEEIKFLSLAGTFADVDGHIGYTQTGTTSPDPSRWGPHAGWVVREATTATPPTKFDPASGFIASANERHDQWTAFPEPPYRHRRLTELLSSRDIFAPADLIRMSYDELDLMCRDLAAAWGPLFPAHDAAAAEMLAWARHQASRQSTHGRTMMAKFHALHREVVRALIERHLDASTASGIVREPAFILGLQDRLDPILCGKQPEVLSLDELGPVVREAWTRIFERTPRPGKDTPVVHSARFHGELERAKLPSWFGLSSEPIELPGGPVSLFQTRLSEIGGSSIISGPAFHLLMNLATTTSRYNLAGGASERWRLEGYGEGLNAWSKGRLIPLGEGPAPER